MTSKHIAIPSHACRSTRVTFTIFVLLASLVMMMCAGGRQTKAPEPVADEPVAEETVLPLDAYEFYQPVGGGLTIAGILEEDADGAGEGLRILLLDSQNITLVEDIGHDFYLYDFTSMEKADAPHPDTAVRVSFPAVGGGYYSFLSYESEFKNWIRKASAHWNVATLAEVALADTVACVVLKNYKYPYSWNAAGNDLAKAAYAALTAELLSIFADSSGAESDVDIQDDPDNSRVILEWIVTREMDGDFIKENVFRFFRTDDGSYRLYEMRVMGNEDFFAAAHALGSAGQDFAVGTTLLANGKTDEALRMFDIAIEKDKTFIHAFINRGVIYGSRGDLARALADADSALAIDSLNAAALNNRGEIYMKMGDYKKAEADLSKAATQGAHQAVYLNLSTLHAATGEDSTSDAYYKKALAMGHESAQNLIRKDIEINKALQEKGKDHFATAAVFIQNGVMYARLDSLHEASNELEAALKFDPKNKIAQSRMKYYAGIRKFREGNTKDAQELFKDALKIDPKYNLAKDMLDKSKN